MRGFIHHGKLFAHLPIIVGQNMAHGAFHKIGSIVVRLVPTVHQQLLGHVHVARCRMGPSQYCTKERRVPTGIYIALLQQEKHHPGGRRQIHYHILQEMTHGLILDPQAGNEESQDVQRDVGNHQQICPG
jgi:hypothetical protein